MVFILGDDVITTSHFSLDVHCARKKKGTWWDDGSPVNVNIWTEVERRFVVERDERWVDVDASYYYMFGTKAGSIAKKSKSRVMCHVVNAKSKCQNHSRKYARQPCLMGVSLHLVMEPIFPCHEGWLEERRLDGGGWLEDLHIRWWCCRDSAARIVI